MVTAVLLAVTQDDRVAYIAAAGVVLAAAIPGTVATITARRTHKVAKDQAAENTEQHGASQRKLEALTEAVHTTGGKVDSLSHRVDTLDHKHDRLADRIARHVGEDANR